MTDRGGLAASAAEIMRANPSTMGWQRVAAEPCNGFHRRAVMAANGLVLWRRQRELFDEATCMVLDVGDDRPLWVAEQVGVEMCVTDRWVWRVRTLEACHPLVFRDLGLPWSVSPGPLGPGTTVTLTTENGRWVWLVTGDRGDLLGDPRRKVGAGCGGYTARWPD